MRIVKEGRDGPSIVVIPGGSGTTQIGIEVDGKAVGQERFYSRILLDRAEAMALAVAIQEIAKRK